MNLPSHGVRALELVLLLAACTQNQRAKHWGGTATVQLPEGAKLISATWKEDQLWYLTPKRREGEPVEQFEFVEESSFGVIEGKVTFQER